MLALTVYAEELLRMTRVSTGKGPLLSRKIG